MQLIDILNKRKLRFEIDDKGRISTYGSLDLFRTGITALPKHLTVGGFLDLCDTGITELPENLNVVGSLEIDVKNITNIAFKHNCGRHQRTIFAAWINGGVNICAGCFLGSLDDFFVAVDRSYGGEEANKYKSDAEYCRDRLIDMRSLKQLSINDDEERVA